MIWVFKAVSVYKNMSNYLLHDFLYVFLSADQVDLCRLRPLRVKRLVFFGMFCHSVMGVMIIYLIVVNWDWIPLLDRIVLPLRLICLITSSLMISCVIPGCICAIFELLMYHEKEVDSELEDKNELDVQNVNKGFSSSELEDKNEQDVHNVNNELSSDSSLEKFNLSFHDFLKNYSKGFGALSFALVWCCVMNGGFEYIWLVFYIIQMLQLCFLQYCRCKALCSDYLTACNQL